jgi:signal transduction histidine kinase
MASLGRLTAGIAHEINTPIAALRSALVEIGKLTEEYRASIGDEGVTAEDHGAIASEMMASIRLANSAAERAAGFVKGIKTQTLNMGQVEALRFDAVPVIEEALLLLNHALVRAKCALGFAHSAERIDLLGTPGRLAQVLTNLVTNAIDACAGAAAPTIGIDLSRRGEGVELRVTDNGTGISSENLSKIFDPLFTTKPIGQGTGLGLTIVHDIVVGEFGGKVEVETALGEGSSFILRFPAQATEK